MPAPRRNARHVAFKPVLLSIAIACVVAANNAGATDASAAATDDASAPKQLGEITVTAKYVPLMGQ